MFSAQQEQRPWQRSGEVLDGPLGRKDAWHLATVTKTRGRWLWIGFMLAAPDFCALPIARPSVRHYAVYAFQDISGKLLRINPADASGQEQNRKG